MNGFDTILIVDWSARSAPSPARRSADAIWIAEARDGDCTTSYHRTRTAAGAYLEQVIATEIADGRRVLAGFDFPFGYPAGFASALTGRADALALWDWMAERVHDGAENANNRFALAAEINRTFSGTGPFWGAPTSVNLPDLPHDGTARRDHGLPERRLVETRVPRAQSCWKLFTTGSVGSQTVLGLPILARLRTRFAEALGVWPFEGAGAQVVLAEVYPSLLDKAVTAAMGTEDIKDEVQVRVLARALAAMQHGGTLTRALGTAEGENLHEEGWILGVGAEADLRAAANLHLPASSGTRLSNDCFALPPGVHWTPVDEALDLLRARLTPVAKAVTMPTHAADGRILAIDHMARRSNPPGANAAVDGYGFAHGALAAGAQALPLVEGRAAAGAPLAGAVPPGHGVRILTGALLPDGVDTVVLQEDVQPAGTRVTFPALPPPGANTRRAGEDVAAGALALPAGHVLRPPDLALLSALGLAEVRVFAPLRVGVLSTGDELVEPGATDNSARTFDANRPMLLSLVTRWGCAAVDLGQVGDDRAALRARLDTARGEADVVLTSGGASAGEEDHVSALLGETGSLAVWRIALKPGRPLALGVWDGMPVFGLPGNPVAALICALIFARPALSLLGGGPWRAPVGFDVPAGFSKRKKAGRQEYLRARIVEGRAETFASEGSGRISGLSWATGLVELGDAARDIAPGDPVRFIPYGAFGF